MRLTQAVVAKLETPNGKSERTVYDDVLTGFGVRLRAGGKKTWVATYRIGRRVRRVTIGDAAVVSLERARAAAKEILSKAKLNHDVQADRILEKEREALTVSTVIDMYLRQYVALRQKERTQLETKRHLNLHWQNQHERPIHHLSQRDIAVGLARIVAENGPVAANRARSAISGLFVWAMRQGLVEQNPVAATAPPSAETSRTRVLTDDEIALVWRHTDDGSDYGRIIRLLLLTGQRRQEVGAIEWHEIDFKRRIWTLPQRRTKNGLQHEVPLCETAISILESAPRKTDRSLIFGQGAGGFSGWSKSKERLDERMISELSAESSSSNTGTIPRWVVHDLRRTAITGMAELGVQPHIIEAVVNHVSGHRASVAGIYNRAKYSEEKRAALERWSAHLMSLIVPITDAASGAR